MLVSVEGSETYRTLSEENMKLQAEIMQYKVIMVLHLITVLGGFSYAFRISNELTNRDKMQIYVLKPSFKGKDVNREFLFEARNSAWSAEIVRHLIF